MGDTYLGMASLVSDPELDVTDRFGLSNKSIHSGPPPPIAAKALGEHSD